MHFQCSSMYDGLRVVCTSSVYIILCVCGMHGQCLSIFVFPFRGACLESGSRGFRRPDLGETVGWTTRPAPPTPGCCTSRSRRWARRHVYVRAELRLPGSKDAGAMTMGGRARRALDFDSCFYAPPKFSFSGCFAARRTDNKRDRRLSVRLSFRL